LKKDQSYFQGSLDKHGWIIELRYYDLYWLYCCATGCGNLRVGHLTSRYGMAEAR
jgi:hypothetical protein